MKTKALLFTVFIIPFFIKVSAQNTADDNIKKSVKMETEAALNGDSTVWQTFFVHDEKTTENYTGNGYNNNITGWQSISAAFIPNSQDSSREKYWFTDTNFIINESGNLSTVQFDQYIFKNKDTVVVNHQYRTMVKVDNDWKIVSLLSINTNSYTSGDSGYIENNLNGTGYQLLGAKKYKDAIEVLRLNVKLFPNSWNVYDSLGEAYADNGNTDDAIKNYETSLKINPKNDNGKQWLEKLKKK